MLQSFRTRNLIRYGAPMACSCEWCPLRYSVDPKVLSSFMPRGVAYLGFASPKACSLSGGWEAERPKTPKDARNGLAGEPGCRGGVLSFGLVTPAKVSTFAPAFPALPKSAI